GRAAWVPTLDRVEVATREREFVRVEGPDAADYLQRMVSNDVESLRSGDACPALLLTAKARVIAPLVVLRRADDDFLLPAEAGLDATHVSFSKGCYPGQEPVARLHFRGHPNRGLRVLELDELPDQDAPLLHEGREVGRVTSAARREDGTVVALAYVRTEV